MCASQRWHYLRFPEKEISLRELLCWRSSEVEGDDARTSHGDRIWVPGDDWVWVSVLWMMGSLHDDKRLGFVYHVKGTMVEEFSTMERELARVYITKRLHKLVWLSYDLIPTTTIQEIGSDLYTNQTRLQKTHISPFAV